MEEPKLPWPLDPVTQQTLRRWLAENTSGVAGADTQVQFNDNGKMGASADFTWDDLNSELQLGDGVANATIQSKSGSGLDVIATGGGNLTLEATGGGGVSINDGSFGANFDLDALSGSQTYAFPNDSGTLALTKHAGTDYQVFTTVGSDTWTKPTGVGTSSMVFVQCWGGGGGGGAANNVVSSGGGGGGGGEYAEGYFRASDLNPTVSLVIGAGGTGGTDVSVVAGTGISTTFGTTLVVARGGLGGEGSSQAGVEGGAGGGYIGGAGGTGGNPGSPSGDSFSGSGGGQGGFDGGAASRGGGGGAGGNSGGKTGGTSAQGGAGGNSSAGNNDGQVGFSPAGGGAGATRITGSTTQIGGVGARGEARIWTIFN